MAGRRHLTRRSVLLGALAAAAAPGCAQMEVGDDPDLRVSREEWPPADGGIGGTGRSGVGVVGTLTDFGSLRVNGLTIETPEDARYVDVFGPVPASRLAIGQSLTVEALQQSDALVARRVAITYPVVGAVQAVREEGRLLTVLGVAVRLDAEAIGSAQVGDRVAVSGLWRGDEIAASRIDPTHAGGPDALSGALSAPDADGVRRIGPVALADTPAATALEGAGYATLVGRWSADGAPGGRFAPSTARPGRFAAIVPQLGALSVEGFLRPIPAAPFFEVSGLGHSFDASAQLAPFAEGRTLFAGRYTGDFEAETGLALPAGFETRRTLLRGTAWRRRAARIQRR